jgi:ABC-type lipoprotein release transport system permease subunit
MMGAVFYRASAELRRSVRRAAVLALLVAFLGGVVLASVAGARRTASAYTRMLDATATPELLVSPAGEEGADPTPFFDAVAALPDVRAVGVIAGMSYLPLAGSPTDALARQLSDVGDIGTMIGPIDGVVGSALRRPVVTDGRLPSADSTDEVFLSRQMARRTGLGVGDVLEVVLVAGETFGVEPAADPSDGVPLRLEIVGVGTFANEVIRYNDLDEVGIFLPSPALSAMQSRSDWGFEGALVDLVDGADAVATIDAINAMAEDPALGTGGAVFVSDESRQAVAVQDGLRPLAVALAAVAAATGVVALVVIGQALARHTRPSAGDMTAMRALGVSVGQRAVVPLVRALAIGLVGAAGAVLISIALSRFFPIGPARVAELHPGLDVDPPVMVLGSLLVVALTVASLAPTAIVRARRERRGTAALGRFATTAAGTAGLPAPEVQGLRLAFGTGPDGSPPARNAVVVAALAVTAVLGTATFASGLSGLVDRPARYGQGWDLLVDSAFAPAPVAMLVERLEDDPRIDGLAVGNYGELLVDGRPVPAVELATVMGSAGITLLEGQQADQPGELVLGGEVLDALGLDVGDDVEVDAGQGAEQWIIVGRAVFPRLGRGSFDGTGLGAGAQVAPGPLELFDVEEEFAEEGFDVAEYELDGRFYSFLAIDAKGDPGPIATDLEPLGSHYFADLKYDLPPTTIRDLDRVRDVPVGLAVVLALVAAAAMAHQLVSSVRERHRELALLRVLGFSSSQLRRTVAGHGALLAVAAAVLGVPLGLALGRTVWAVFADGLYVDPSAPVPWVWVAGAIPAAILLAGFLAIIPSLRAARVRVATALREDRS